MLMSSVFMSGETGIKCVCVDGMLIQQGKQKSKLDVTMRCIRCSDGAVKQVKSRNTEAEHPGK